MERPEDTVKQLALHDPQVSHAMRFYVDGSLTWTETLERLVIVLVESKQMLNKEIDRAYQLRCPHNGPTYNVAGNSEILGEA